MTKTKTVAAPVVAEQPKNLNGILAIKDPTNILHSKRWVTGNVQYPSPIEIFTPMYELLKSTGGELMVMGEDETKNAEADGTENISYGRMKLTAKYKIDTEVFYELGFLVALDLTHPKMKIYRGAVTQSCLNLNVFGSDDVVKFEIAQGFNVDIAQNYISSVTKKIKESVDRVNEMKGMLIPQDKLERLIGKMTMDTIKDKLPHGVTVINQAVGMFTDKNNKYYAGQENFNAWLLYNALTENNNRKSAFDIPEKSLSTYELVSSVLN
jgi:hypothetical protein